MKEEHQPLIASCTEKSLDFHKSVTYNSCVEGSKEMPVIKYFPL